MAESVLLPGDLVPPFELQKHFLKMPDVITLYAVYWEIALNIIWGNR